MAALPRHPECEDSSQPFSTQYAIRAYLGCVFFVWYAALQQGIKAVLVLHCSISEFRGFGCKARKEGSSATSPTSPRREASLLDLPGLVPGIFLYHRRRGAAAMCATAPWCLSPCRRQCCCDCEGLPDQRQRAASILALGDRFSRPAPERAPQRCHPPACR